MIRFKSNRGRTARRRNPTKHFDEQTEARIDKSPNQKRLRWAMDHLIGRKGRFGDLPNGQYSIQISGKEGEAGDYLIIAVIGGRLDAILTYRGPDQTPKGTRRDTAIIQLANIVPEEMGGAKWAKKATNAFRATAEEIARDNQVMDVLSVMPMSETELTEYFEGAFPIGKVRTSVRRLFAERRLDQRGMNQRLQEPKYGVPLRNNPRRRTNPSVEALRKEYARYRRDTIKEWEYKRIVDPSQSQEKLNALFDDTVKETLVHAHLKGTPEDYVEAARGLFNHFRFYTGD